MTSMEVNRRELENMLRSPALINRAVSKISSVRRMRFSKLLLGEAAPLIEASLRSAENLPMREGKKEFYDTETRAMSQTRSKKTGKYKIPHRNKWDRHLIDEFEVTYLAGAGGHGKLIVSNNKKVYSNKGEFELFKLLWEGTNTYVVPMPLSKGQLKHLKQQYGKDLAEKQKRVMKWRARDILAAYNRRMKSLKKEMHAEAEAPTVKVSEEKKWRRQFAKESTGRMTDFRPGDLDSSVVQARSMTGRRMIRETKAVQVTMKFEDFEREYGTPKMMHFYDRFKEGFTLTFVRRGIESPVVESFRGWVTDCIVDGLILAYDNLDRGRVEDELERVVEQVRYDSV